MSGQEKSADGSSNGCQSKCEKKATKNPYPNGWMEITAVKYCDPLILVRCKAPNILGNDEAVKGKEFIVGRAYKVKYKWKDAKGVIHGYCSVVVPCGLVTDLASIPWYGRWLVSKVGRYLEACIVHDYLYGAQLGFGRGNRKEDRKFADELHKQLMEAADVSRFKRSLIYKAVRWRGESAFKKRNRYVGQKCCGDASHKICCDNTTEPCPKNDEETVSET